MGIIHLLNSEISNKIAAGEVVERPSSVVKELVENSIDAKSTNISVEIKNGGAVFIRVTDNGSGMSEEDAKTCFLRHATSKISTDADLDAIYTLGFRGEALSSIGAVSEMTMSTKRREDDYGTRVTCRGGEIMAAEAAGTPDGTDIIVENLFYNTPARRKFLKKDATEAGYITDIMTKFIFAHPEISFRLIVNGKEKLYSAGDNSLKNAVYTVYGKDYAKHMKEVSYTGETVTVEGLIGTGNVSRPNRNYQSYFVNSRYIKSPIITRAVEEAYKNQIMIGKFPAAILNLKINAGDVDINVHPTKLEVKFSNEREIYQSVYYGVRNTLYSEANVPEIVHSEAAEESREGHYLSDMAKNLPKNLSTDNRDRMTAAEFRSSVEKSVKDINRRPDIPNYDARKNPFIEEKPTYVPHQTDNRLHEPQMADKPILPKEKEQSFSGVQEELIPDNSTEAASVENVFADEYFEIVGQVFDTYIIAEKNGEMLIIDQHAAHERLKYEELLKDLENKQAFSQMLIEPVVISMTGEEYAAFDAEREVFFDMGFECDDFGDNTVMVRSVPGDTEIGGVETLFLELVTEAQKLKKELITTKQQRLLYTIACKSAVKANMRMSREEMETLTRRVLRLKNINTCPHGRPIIITMSKKELEKEFGRIV